jgi:5-methylcytosine-specific restriction endonuclease McrA
MSLPLEIRRAVRERARDRCEYCGILQNRFPLVTFHVEHVIARQHGGSNDLSNLCLACHWRNLFNSKLNRNSRFGLDGHRFL